MNMNKAFHVKTRGTTAVAVEIFYPGFAVRGRHRSRKFWKQWIWFLLLATDIILWFFKVKYFMCSGRVVELRKICMYTFHSSIFHTLLNPFVTHRAQSFEKTKNYVFLDRNWSRRLLDKRESAIGSLDVCLWHDRKKSTFSQHLATLEGFKIYKIDKKHAFFWPHFVLG